MQTPIFRRYQSVIPESVYRAATNEAYGLWLDKTDYAPELIKRFVSDDRTVSGFTIVAGRNKNRESTVKRIAPNISLILSNFCGTAQNLDRILPAVTTVNIIPPGSELLPHTDNDISLNDLTQTRVACVQGEGMFTIGDVSTETNPGDLLEFANPSQQSGRPYTFCC